MHTESTDRRMTVGAVALAMTLVIGIGAIDALTGPQLSVAMLYLVPIALAAWFAGRGPGLVVAVAATGVWIAADLLLVETDVPLQVNLWNIGMRLATFCLVGALVGQLRRSNQTLSRRVINRTARLKTEIVEHRRVLAQLRISEQRFRTLLETVQDTAMFMLDADGRIASWNGGAERMTGYAEAEALGLSLAILATPLDAQRGQPDDWLHQAAQRGTCPSEGWHQRRDGSQFWAACMLSAFRGARNELLGYSLVMHDLTARRQLEDEIVRVEEAERTRLGQELHDVLGSDLAAVLFMARNLEATLGETELAQAEEARQLAVYAGETLQKARALARGISGAAVTAERLENCFLDLAHRTQEVFGVRCELACPGAQEVHDAATALHLYRIAQEAVNNAVKHGRAKTIAIELVAAAGRIELQVRDDGCGIAGNSLHRGMGLRVMRHRAGAMGGRLSIDQGPAGGTIVCCSAPLMGKAALEVSAGVSST